MVRILVELIGDAVCVAVIYDLAVKNVSKNSLSKYTVYLIFC